MYAFDVRILLEQIRTVVTNSAWTDVYFIHDGTVIATVE